MNNEKPCSEQSKKDKFITTDVDNSECDNFIVRNSFVFNSIFLLFSIISVLLLFKPFRPSNVRTGYYVFLIFYALFFLFAQICLFLFQIKISGIHFTVRLYNGKKISFDCSDIYRISSCKRSVYYGAAYYLQFKIFTRKYKSPIIISPDYKGFRQLAKYLITRLNTGDIRRFAVSDSCEKELLKYVNKDN